MQVPTKCMSNVANDLKYAYKLGTYVTKLW